MDLHFHTKRGVCVQGASLIAEKGGHVDAFSLFPCRMKTAMESDSKAFSPGRTIRQLAIKKMERKKKLTDYVLQAFVPEINKCNTFSN